MKKTVSAVCIIIIITCLAIVVLNYFTSPSHIKFGDVSFIILNIKYIAISMICVGILNVFGDKK